MGLGIITRQTVGHSGLQVIIYRKGSGYQVGLIHPSQQLEVLKDAKFWSYDAANTRLLEEVAQRR